MSLVGPVDPLLVKAHLAERDKEVLVVEVDLRKSHRETHKDMVDQPMVVMVEQEKLNLDL
tara:strand:+ start:265 stop:444 length:180 start_codon:yes stop_codon:yes gene_type:complete